MRFRRSSWFELSSWETLRLSRGHRDAAAWAVAVCIAVPVLAQPAFAQTEPAPPAAAPLAPAPVAAPAPSTPNPSPESVELERRFSALVNRPGGLTATQAAERAVRASTAVKGRALETRAAQVSVAKAQNAYLPDLTLTASYTRYSSVDQGAFGPQGTGSLVIDPTGGEGPVAPGTPLVRAPVDFSFPVLLNQYWLQAGLTVPLSDYVLRTGQGLAAARHNRDAARLNERAARLTAAADAKLTYYAWVRAQLGQVVSEQTVSQAQETLRQTRVSFEGGRLSRADVLRAESQLSSAELMLSQARHTVALAEERLRTALRDTLAERYQIGEDVLAEPADTDPRGDAAALYSEALSKRLEVRALGENARGLRSAGAALKADAYPRLEAFANGYYVNPHPRITPQTEEFTATWDAGLRLTWTPTKIGTARADVQSYRIQAEQRENELQQFADALRTEVLEARQTLVDAALDHETAKRGLASAEEGYRVRRELYRNGRGTSVDVTDAETELLRARLALINSKIAVLTARVRLEHATGRDVE
jgi:outer membrane protein TolC